MPRGVYDRSKSKPRKPGATPPQPRSQPAATPAAPATDFVAAMTADTRLVVIGRGSAPEIYTPEQTQDLATLLSNHFEV